MIGTLGTVCERNGPAATQMNIFRICNCSTGVVWFGNRRRCIGIVVLIVNNHSVNRVRLASRFLEGFLGGAVGISLDVGHFWSVTLVVELCFSLLGFQFCEIQKGVPK